MHIATVAAGSTVDRCCCGCRRPASTSLPGGGAEVLADRVRRAISPHKIPADSGSEVMRSAHAIGMPSTATMMFGSLDTPAERVEHLRRIRDLQDETGGFTAFIPWTFQAGNTDLPRGTCPPPAGTICACSPSAASTSTTCPTSRRRG